MREKIDKGLFRHAIATNEFFYSVSTTNATNHSSLNEKHPFVPLLKVHKQCFFDKNVINLIMRIVKEEKTITPPSLKQVLIIVKKVSESRFETKERVSEEMVGMSLQLEDRQKGYHVKGLHF
jgi:hypothetical protein